MTAETAGAGDCPDRLRPPGAASASPAGAGRVSARSVPTRRRPGRPGSAPRSCAAPARRRRPRPPRRPAPSPCRRADDGRPAGSASGQKRERERGAGRAARARSTGTTRTPSTVSAAMQSTGARVRVTSRGVGRRGGLRRAAATRRRRPPPGAPVRPRAAPAHPARDVGPGAAARSASVATRAVVRASARGEHGEHQGPRDRRVLREPGGREVGQVGEARVDDGRGRHRQRPRPRAASRSASTPAAGTCWRRPSPRARRRSRSSSRTDATSRPASSAAARASAVPRSSTTSTVARVLACWAWRRVRVRGRSEASRVIRARSPTSDRQPSRRVVERVRRGPQRASPWPSADRRDGRSPAGRGRTSPTPGTTPRARRRVRRSARPPAPSL